jgi:hypothetical protein
MIVKIEARRIFAPPYSSTTDHLAVHFGEKEISVWITVF